MLAAHYFEMMWPLPDMLVVAVVAVVAAAAVAAVVELVLGELLLLVSKSLPPRFRRY